MNQSFDIDAAMAELNRASPRRHQLAAQFFRLKGDVAAACGGRSIFSRGPSVAVCDNFHNDLRSLERLNNHTMDTERILFANPSADRFKVYSESLDEFGSSIASVRQSLHLVS